MYQENSLVRIRCFKSRSFSSLFLSSLIQRKMICLGRKRMAVLSGSLGYFVKSTFENREGIEREREERKKQDGGWKGPACQKVPPS